MTVTEIIGGFIYDANGGDWRVTASPDRFEIVPLIGGLEYQSGVNLDNLAALIESAKAHATANGIDWENN